MHIPYDNAPSLNDGLITHIRRRSLSVTDEGQSPEHTFQYCSGPNAIVDARATFSKRLQAFLVFGLSAVASEVRRASRSRYTLCLRERTCWKAVAASLYRRASSGWLASTRHVGGVKEGGICGREWKGGRRGLETYHLTSAFVTAHW